MIQYLAHVRAEALCEHQLEVRTGPSLGVFEVRHDQQQCAVRCASLGTVRQDRELRLAILEWVCRLHEESEVRHG